LEFFIYQLDGMIMIFAYCKKNALESTDVVITN